jgi:hypothetical protein
MSKKNKWNKSGWEYIYLKYQEIQTNGMTSDLG